MDRRANREDLLYSWEIPSHSRAEKEIVIMASDKEITKDSLQNQKAVMTMIFDVERLIEDADLLDKVQGPELCLKGYDPVLEAWYDRNNLEKLMTETKKMIRGQVTPESIQSAATLSAFYFNDAIKSFNCHLEIIDDMVGRLMMARVKVLSLSNETREPETLEEVAREKGNIDTCNEVIEACQSRVIRDKAKIINSLQVRRYIQEVTLG